MRKTPTLVEIMGTKLDADHVPREALLKLSIGYGQNHPCAACERAILHSEVQHELQFAMAG